MVDFKWIHISLFLIAVLQFPAAAEGLPSSFTVRAGQEVTLPCESVISDQQNCDSTTWIFSYLSQRAAVELITLGQIAKSNSVRPSVTQKCSLVIQNVTDEDAGRYYCQQWKSGQSPDSQSVVHLSVVTITEHRSSDQVTLNCSVSPYERWCLHTVKWLYAGKDVDEDHKDLQTSQSVCSASVTFLIYHRIYKSNSDLLKCEVTDENKVQQQFPFRLQPSGDNTTNQRPKTNKDKDKTKPKTKPTPTTTKRSMKRGTITTASATNDDSANLKGDQKAWWWIIVALAVAAALLIVVVAVIRWKRTKGKKTQTDQNIGRSLNPAVTPGTSQDTADPEGDVSYASVSFTKNSDSEGRVQGQGDDAVTYTTLKASSSSAAASADNHVLYATVNKPNK